MARRFPARLAWILAGAAVLGAVVSGGAVRHYGERRRDLARLEERRADLARRVRDLEARSARAENDDGLLEIAARRELGVIGPGEIDFRFVDDPPPVH